MKKRTILTLSLSLIVCFTLSFFPNATPVTAMTHIPNTAADDLHILAENISLRNEFEKHFLMSDGSYQVALYNEPIHKVENGKWVEIDNTLHLQRITNGSTQYITSDGLANVRFAEKFGDQLVTLQQGSYSLTWGLHAVSVGASKSAPEALTQSVPAEVIETDLSSFNEDEQKTLAAKSSSAIQYRNALAPNVDLEYIVLPSRVKENIILQNENNISHYVVTLTTENLSARLLENREIELYNDLDDVVFTMTSPYMYDGAGELSENIQVEMIPVGKGCYRIKITPDTEWLKSEQRVYPVVIDPQVFVDSARSNIIDNYVLQGSGNQNNNLDRLYIGKKSGSTARAFIKYKYMPTIPATATITSATMTLTLASGTKTAANASAYKVTGGDWASGTITWANMPAASTTIATNISHNNLSKYSFSCKTAVQSWYSGSTTGSNANYGIMLRYYDESVNDYNAVYSADYTTESKRPSLTISYTGATGTTKTFAAFDVGDSSQDEVSFMSNWMSEFGYISNGLYDNARGTVSASTIKVAARNADVVYINSHGGEKGNIYIHNSNGNLTSYLCADASVAIDDGRPKEGIGAEFKDGSTTKTNSYWNYKTKWVILSPCAQLNYGSQGAGLHWNNLNSAGIWARTMLADGQRIHGYVGYHGQAPNAEAHLDRLNNVFNYALNNNYPIVDAWAQGHTKLGGSSDWAAIYHSANANDRFQSMSQTTPNGASYEIYYIANNITERQMDLDVPDDSDTKSNILETQLEAPQFTDNPSGTFSAEATYLTLSQKLNITDNSILKVEDSGRITYSVGSHNWGANNLTYDLNDSEAIAKAEELLDELGILPKDNYRAVVSRTERVKLELTGSQNPPPETIEYTVSFYRTHNGIDILSDQEDGIIVSFNKHYLTELRYYWRELASTRSIYTPDLTKISLEEARNIYRSSISNSEAFQTTESTIEPVFTTIAYMQIDNQVTPVWAFSTDNNYTNAIFVDMYTGEVLSAY